MTAALLLALALQEPAAPPLIIVIPSDLLAEVKRPAPEEGPETVYEVDLTIPTSAYVAAVSAAWAGAAATCVDAGACATVTPTLPTVSTPKTAYVLGLAIQGAALWTIHAWVAPRWPRVAQGLLYGLGTMHAVKAADHVLASRRQSRASQ